MIEKIPVIWIKPKGDRLPKFKLISEVTINGYVIQSGFITDGASIPWGARNTFNPLGQAFPAAIAHDKRCKDNEPRKMANKLFLRDLLDCGINKLKANAMYMGVEAYRVVKRIP
jgi:hypothetical protein